MTRGKIIYIDKNEIMYCSCEFNGDMHPEHKGDQIIENFQNGNFKSVTDYEKYVERFNDRNFGYDDISIACRHYKSLMILGYQTLDISLQ